MPAQRLSIRQVREVLRLKWACGLSDRKIAQSLRVSRPTVAEYIRRAQAAGLSWPLPDALDETTLERRLFATAAKTPVAKRPIPDWGTVHRELKRKGVTLVLLWQEYKAITPDGLQYSQCCEAYRQWAGKLDLVMRQSHHAGDTLFVDYAGQTMPVVNALTGEVREAAIFIAVLGASNYTYAEATWTQSLPDWIGSHVRACAALGGVPQVVVPDNLKAAVRRPHRYEPILTRTYAELAQHYGVANVPARAAHPRDKAKVEVGVQVVERWILARLRHHTFLSLLELNTAIAALLVTLNQRPFKKLPGSRQSVFEALDRPALRPLPVQPSEYAEWKLVRVNIDYHVDVEGHYYSVPYALVKQQLEVRLSAQVVEIFHTGTRVASPQRSPLKGRHSTVAVHMPKAHQHYAEWTPHRLMLWAAKTGEATTQVVETILASRPHDAPAGLPRLLGHHAAGQTRWRGPPRSRLSARHPHRCMFVQEYRIDSQTRSRPAALAWSTHCRPRDYAWQYPGRAVLPHQHRRTYMLNHPTLDKLLALRLTGMAKALSEQMDLPESQTLSFEERLGLLVDREMTVRSDRRLTTRLRQAQVRLSASIEGSDYRHPRGLDKSLMLRLASCQWIHDRHNVLITGPTGIGKPQPRNYPCRSQYRTGRHHHGYRSPSPALWSDPHAGRDDSPCRTRPLLCGVAAAPGETPGPCTGH
jgi:transposase